jgi:hypothetical protein
MQDYQRSSDVDEFLIAYNSIDEDEQARLLMLSPYDTIEEARAHLRQLQEAERQL